jgi:sugar phosphate isomerase/epimerase
MGRLAISELTTFSWSFEEDVLQYAAAGVSAIGVWRDKLTDFGVEKGRELLQEHDLAVSSLQWAGGFTGSDGRSFEDSLRDAIVAVRTAAVIGAPCLIVYSGGRGGHTRRHAQRLFESALRGLLPHAEEHGITLAVEPMHPACASEWTMLTSLADATQLLERFPSPHIQLAFDLYHAQHVPRRDWLSQVMPRVALVQLGDARRPPMGEQNRCPLGEGVLPLADTVSRFNEAGYRGFYEVELLGEDLDTTDYADLVRGSQQAVTEML